MYACACVCVCMYTCVRACLRASEIRRALPCTPGPVRSGLSVSWVLSCAWEWGGKLPPRQALARGRGWPSSGLAMSLFLTVVYGVCLHGPPFPHPFFLTFPCNNSLVSPFLPPTPHFFHFLLIKISHHPKQNWDTSIHFFFLLFVFCLWTHISLGNVSSLPLHVCLNSHWLSTPSLSKNDVFPSRTPSGLPSQSGGGGRRASALVRPRARLHQARKAQPSFIQTVPNPAPLPGNLKARLVP